MKYYAYFYTFYKSIFMRLVRLTIFLILCVWILAAFGNETSFKFPHLLLHLFVMVEIFYRYKVSRMHPTIPVTTNTGDIFHSFTLPVLYTYFRQSSASGFLRELLKTPQGTFMLTKMQIQTKDLQLVKIQNDVLLKGAFETVKTVGGTYVTVADVLATYFLMTEVQTKLLFAKQLKDTDLLDMVRWVRATFPEEEQYHRQRVRFSGSGVGEALISGWTPETKNFTDDFTYAALRKKPLVTGREKEYALMLETLNKAENNNVLLVGEPGSGKEQLVTVLAQQSFTGILPGRLNAKHFLELMMGQLIAGAADRNQLEVRLQAIIAEVSHSLNMLLYIPEFQNMMGAGSYNINLSGAILPYLKNGSLPIVASMTTGAYKAYFEQSSLREVFTVIKFPEPDAQTAKWMLFAKTSEIEQQYNVLISYAAVVAAVEYAGRYVQDDVLPGSAVMLLTDAANVLSRTKEPYFKGTHKKMLQKDHVTQIVEQKTHVAVSAPKAEEKELLLHMEGKLHERVIGQNDAVNAVAESLRRLRTGIVKRTKPISFLFLGPTGVGKTETAKTLADLYFGGAGNMIRLDMSEYADELGERRLLGAPPGQGDERGELTDKVHDNPFSLVLLDEFEKASPKIRDLFLQVLDDGRLTDNKGKTVSFINTIIIATSNAGSEFIRQEISKGVKVDAAFKIKLFELLQSEHIFKPELLNRFDAVITFQPLTGADVMQVVKLMLTKLTESLEEQDITVTFDEAVIKIIATKGFDKQFGARPLQRYIQETIEDTVAKLKLEDKIQRGSTIVFSADNTGMITTAIS